MRFRRRVKAPSADLRAELEHQRQVLLAHGLLETRVRPDGRVVYVMTPAGRRLMGEDP